MLGRYLDTLMGVQFPHFAMMRMGHILPCQVHPFLLGMWLVSQTRRTRKVVVMIVMIVMTLFRSVHHLQQNQSFLCTWSAMGPSLVWSSLAVLAI